MDWIQISIDTTQAGIDPVCGVLLDCGITGMEIDDSEEFHAFLEENRDKWDYVDDELLKAHEQGTCVRFYVSDNAAGADQRSAVCEGLRALAGRDTEKAFGTLSLSAVGMKEEDWAENWKQYFKPLEVGDKILILPEWETLDKPTERTVFTVNPGMSFGTGSHHTTQLCIRSLETYLNQGMEVLDLGCGSGILSIIALLLGASSATAVDIDPNAVDIAVKNAKRNGVDLAKYRTFSGNITTDTDLLSAISDKKYDIVLANIVADVIIGIKNTVPPLLKENGIYITSGIITDRREDVLSAYENVGLTKIAEFGSGDWISLVYRK